MAMEHIPKGWWTVGALVALTCGFLLWQGMSIAPGPPPAQPAPNPPPTDPPAQPPTPSEQIVVHVAGAVKKPGIVRIPRGSRVDDAVKAAGGFSEKADPDSVNLAQPLEDGVQVYVPRKSEPVQVEGRVGTVERTRTPSSGEQPTGKININTATAEQLESLPGVGPAIARAIVEYRKQNGGFRSVDELLEVRGIGEKRLLQIRPFVVAR